MGMPHNDIPRMMGIVLSSTKYGVKQNRGRFGLGAKMALIWSKMTTALPITIRSCCKGKPVSHYDLDIDIRKNEPRIMKNEQLPNNDWHGTEITLTIEGSWSKYGARVLKYLRQMAVITPYAEFSLSYESETSSKSVKQIYERRSDKMPPCPTYVKHHPSSVNLVEIKNLIEGTKNQDVTLDKFLMKEFDKIDKGTANKIIEKMEKHGYQSSLQISRLTTNELRKLEQIFRGVDFPPPDGKCLSPAGEYNLRLGIQQQVEPQYIATYSDKPKVLDGHSFIVEAGVAIGGNDATKPGITVYRFANRIPMLFEGGSDVVTRCANKFNWSSYKIKPTTDKIAVFVSIVSTKIPFKGTSKEYIGEDGEALTHSVKYALGQCCSQIKQKIVKAAALSERQNRKKKLTRYIQDVSNAVFNVMSSVIEPREGESGDPIENARKRLKLSDDHVKILQDVKQKTVTLEALRGKLSTHIDQVDFEQALDYVASHGVESKNREDIFIAPFKPDTKVRTVRHPLFTFNLLDAACVAK